MFLDPHNDGTHNDRPDAVETQNFASLPGHFASLRSDHASLPHAHAHDPLRYKGKYRVSSARKRTWDYGSNAVYFVTICTKNREPYFGTIDDDAMHVAVGTQSGNVETQNPVETQNFASLHGNFASLQNPHASLPTENEYPYAMIDHTRMNITPLGDCARQCWAAIPHHFPFVHLDAFVAMPDHVHGIVVIQKSDDGVWKTNRFGPQSGNLGSIIRGFKIGVTKFARDHDMDFAWQARFHDRIVREDDNLGMIRFYIASNPLRWFNESQSSFPDDFPV